MKALLPPPRQARRIVHRPQPKPPACRNLRMKPMTLAPKLLAGTCALSGIGLIASHITPLAFMALSATCIVAGITVLMNALLPSRKAVATYETKERPCETHIIIRHH